MFEISNDIEEDSLTQQVDRALRDMFDNDAVAFTDFIAQILNTGVAQGTVEINGAEVAYTIFLSTSDEDEFSDFAQIDL